jgi:hypothetical protein
MALQEQVFASFTPGLWQAFVNKIKADTGVVISTNTGTVKHGSFEFTYDYNPDTQMLVVQCTKKPLFIPANVILNGLSQEIAELKTVEAPQVASGSVSPASVESPEPPALSV